MNPHLVETSAIVAEQVYTQRIEAGHNKFQSKFQGEFQSLGGHEPFSPDELTLTLVHRWGRMAELYGDNLALEEGERTLTYAETNLLANRVAHAILAHTHSTQTGPAQTLSKDVPVGLLFDLECDLPVGILAVWKAGHFFAWFESRQPLARIQFMLEESGAGLVITNRKHEPLARQLCGGVCEVLVIEDLTGELPTHNPPITAEASHPAYLVYTSGSTGTPKGTVELHRNLVYFLSTRELFFRCGPRDRVAFLMYGVGCILPMTSALMYGGCLLPFEFKGEGLTSFSRWLIERRVTFAPSGADLRTWLLGLDGSLQFPDLRVLSLAAGPSYREHIEAYRRYLPDNCVLIVIYSSTETRHGTLALIDKETPLEGRFVPAGYPVSPSAVEIWDEEDWPQPTGEKGEIIIFSPYLSVGYWKSPELTASKYGVDARGRRFHRTGDLGRLDDQHCLWVLGRKDSQIKIRGNRVETAEIEEALRELPTVQEAAVVDYGETDEARVLVGFVAASERNGERVRGNELRQQLLAHLPDYMVPSVIVVTEELPRNGNGKVARPILRQMAITLLPSARDSSLGNFSSNPPMRSGQV